VSPFLKRSGVLNSYGIFWIKIRNEEAVTNLSFKKALRLKCLGVFL